MNQLKHDRIFFHLWDLHICFWDHFFLFFLNVDQTSAILPFMILFNNFCLQERPVMSDAQRRKQREQVQKEVDKLRGSIQALTRSANPLGKVWPRPWISPLAHPWLLTSLPLFFCFSIDHSLFLFSSNLHRPFYFCVNHKIISHRLLISFISFPFFLRGDSNSMQCEASICTIKSFHWIWMISINVKSWFLCLWILVFFVCQQFSSFIRVIFL